ncbi:MAG: DUF4232 domain-containing protein [Corynebacterium sp.]|nr:DUF4232 domain-containing protein [Corynebacterium sp.]
MTKRALCVVLSTILAGSVALSGCSKTIDPVKNAAMSTSQKTSVQAPDNESNSQEDAQANICLANNLTASISSPEGSAGSSYYTVTLVNAGSACSLRGYAGVSLVDSSGNQIGAAADRDGDTGQLVTLNNGDNSIFNLQISNAMAYGDCTVSSTAGLKIYPPENRESITVPLRTQTCAEDNIHTMTISPVK